MLIMIDNYDSFTYNLVQYFMELGQNVRIYRNDQLTIDDIRSLRPTCIVISPGPGSPSQAGISIATIRHLGAEVPILGVCLGHQSIAEAYGGRICSAKALMHGKVSRIHHRNTGVFRGLPSPLEAARYHSLAVDPGSLPDCLDVTAWADDGEIMGVRHKRFPVEGVQFHPESILTQFGRQALSNFLHSL